MSAAPRIRRCGALQAEELFGQLAVKLSGDVLCHAALEQHVPERLIWAGVTGYGSSTRASLGFSLGDLSVEALVTLLDWLVCSGVKLCGQKAAPPHHCFSFRTGNDGYPALWAGFDQVSNERSEGGSASPSFSRLPHRLALVAQWDGDGSSCESRPLVRAVGSVFVIVGRAARRLNLTWEENGMEEKLIERCETPLTVELGEVLLSIGQLSKLRPGDVLELALRRPQPVRLSLEGVPIVRGALSIEDETMEITVQELIVTQHFREVSDCSKERCQSSGLQAQPAARDRQSSTPQGEEI